MSRMTWWMDLEIEDRSCVTLLPCWTRSLTSSCWFFLVRLPRAPQWVIFRGVVCQGTCRLYPPGACFLFIRFFFFGSPASCRVVSRTSREVNRRLRRLGGSEGGLDLSSYGFLNPQVPRRVVRTKPVGIYPLSIELATQRCLKSF